MNRRDLEVTLKRLARDLEQGVDASTFADECERISRQLDQADLPVYWEWLLGVVQLVVEIDTATVDHTLH